MSKIRRTGLSAICLLLAINLAAQRVESLQEKKGISLRGLSVVSDDIFWVSGSGGTVGVSADGGKTIRWTIVPGYESFDFRDVEGFTSNAAVIMSAGEPAVILKTTDGGRSWKNVFQDDRPGMFLDAMSFLDGNHGIVIGDPVDGRFFLATTSNGGNTWKEVSREQAPPAAAGEACFAASGSNIYMLSRREFLFVSGGMVSRLHRNRRAVDLSLLHGGETQGANSVACWNEKKLELQIAVAGGDFTADSMRRGNCVVSRDGGKSWITPSNPPYGYRSCIEYVSASQLIACGLNGVDISLDGGINWNSISADGFHTCRKAKKGGAVFLAGSGGRIAKIIW